MKHVTFSLLLIFAISFSSFGQYKLAEGLNYSGPVQIDSSDIYVIGSLLNKSDKAKYNMGMNQMYDYSLQNSWTNKDGVIDEDDPISLFICTKDGNGLTQISPKDMNVNSFKTSRDGKTLLINVQKDKNGDKKFSNEDELLYQINLDEDISKIKATQMNL